MVLLVGFTYVCHLGAHLITDHGIWLKKADVIIHSNTWKKIVNLPQKVRVSQKTSNVFQEFSGCSDGHRRSSIMKVTMLRWSWIFIDSTFRCKPTWNVKESSVATFSCNFQYVLISLNRIDWLIDWLLGYQDFNTRWFGESKVSWCQFFLLYYVFQYIVSTVTSITVSTSGSCRFCKYRKI